MTEYSPDDLSQGWEFKILRSATSRFKDPAFLKACLDEEARAGWTLIEKFDNSRIRLKRPASSRSTDAGLGHDPYRTYVGTTEVQLAITIVAAIVVVLALVVVIALVLR